MKRKHDAIFLVIPAALALLASAVVPFKAAHGATASPRGGTVSRAIGVFITPRGQSYFRDNLQDVIFRNGYSLTDGGFEGWKYQATEPLRLDALPLHMQPFAGTLGQVRDILKQWLRGFQLNDPLFNADVQDIEYSAQFTRFGVRADLDATSHSERNSVIVVFEAEIPKIKVEVGSVMAQDLNNPFLKVFGANKLWAGLADQSVPLTIQVPIKLKINETGGVQVSVLGLTSNISAVQFDLGYAPPLVLPTVEIFINGHRVAVNQKALEANLLKHKADLIRALQTYLGKYAEDNAPTVINTFIAQKLPHGFMDENRMDPPGAPVPGRDTKYIWGIIPQEISLNRDYLYVGLNGYVEDPKSRSQGTSQFYTMSNSTPRLDQLDVNNYDLAMALNQNLINRMLELSFNRGYFSNLATGGEPLSLARQPVIRMDGSMARDRAKLHLRVSQKVTGIRKLIVHSPFEFDVDMNVRLVHTDKGALSLVIDSLDENSVKIEDRYIKMGIFKRSVYGSVKKKIRQANDGFRKKAMVLVDNMPIPSAVAGIPIQVKDFQSDANGYLVLYLEYKGVKR